MLMTLSNCSRPANLRVPARNDTRTVQIPRQTLVENLIDKRTLPGAGNTGHTGQHAKRKLYVDFFQIVLLRTTHLNPAVPVPAVPLAPGSRIRPLR